MNDLIVTCDDCGLSEGVNHACFALHHQGIVTSASLMTNFGASRHALELFRESPALGVGVHLNLSDGYPLTRPPSSAELVGSDGHFRSSTHLVRRALAPSASLTRAIKEELTAQIEVLAQAGFAPQHLTTHLQFHLFPRLREIVFQLAEAYHVPWVRPYRLRATVMIWNPLLDRNLARPGDGTPKAQPVPDYLAVIKDWLSRKPEALARTLASLNGTVELVVHPGANPDPAFPAYVRYSSQARLAEMRYLEHCWPLIAYTRRRTQSPGSDIPPGPA